MYTHVPLPPSIHKYCSADRMQFFRSVVFAKLRYACSAWWGFTNVIDWQQVNAFCRRRIRCGHCPPNLPPFEELCQAADQQLFSDILTNSSHLQSINQSINQLSNHSISQSINQLVIGLWPASQVLALCCTFHTTITSQ